MCGALFSEPVSAFVQYSTGALLNPGDVTSSHIRDGEIVNADVSSTALIDPLKLKGGTLSRALWFDAGNRVGTSSLFTVTTTTPTLTINGGLVVASTTRLNGVTYTWPSADGSNGQGIVTNGSGTLSWGTLSATWLSRSFTAGEAITTFMPVWAATTTISRADYNITTSNTTVDWGRCTPDRRGVGQVFNLPASVMVASSTFVLAKVGSPADNVFVGMYNTSGGILTGSPLASTSISGTSLTTSAATSTFVWPRSYLTQGSTTVALVLTRTGSCSDTDYYRIWYFDVSGSQAGHYTENNAGTWITNSCCDVPVGLYTTAVSVGQVFQASADRAQTSYGVVGIAQNTVSLGGSVNVVYDGTIGGMSNWVAKAPYYLCDNTPAICVSPGTNNVRLGTGYTSTLFRIWSQLTE